MLRLGEAGGQSRMVVVLLSGISKVEGEVLLNTRTKLLPI